MYFISIIIPAFNAERWLRRTLESVEAVIDSDCEVIIVNDGSVDHTGEIAEEFVEKDPRFTITDIEHVGPCAARKAGFLEAQGDYIMFVDSDDLLPSNTIKDLRRLLTNWNEDKSLIESGQTTDGLPKMVIANTIERRGDESHLILSGAQRALTGFEYACQVLDRSIYGFLPGHLYARELLEAIDWDDDPIITHHENFYLLLSMAVKLNEMYPDQRLVLIAPSVVAYQYVRRPGSQSGLMALTPMGLQRVMKHINNLNLPEKLLVIWGLDIIRTALIDRGIPFPNSYPVAAKLREKYEEYGDQFPEEYQKIAKLLYSEKKRTKIAAELARTAGWTLMWPHLSIVMVCGHDIEKVKRTVKSVFDMGFRNLEVILVEMNNSHSERVAINQISIKYPRVRIVTAEPGDDIFRAAARGVDVAEGLCLAFMRPGDLCKPEGLYDAVTRIDYGADAVMTNYRGFKPITRFKGKLRSFAHIRSTEEGRNASKTAANATENVYETIVNAIKEPDEKEPIYIFGIVWRTDLIKEKKIHTMKLNADPDQTLSYVFMRYLMKDPLRVVTQDVNTPPAFEYASPSLLGLLKRK